MAPPTLAEALRGYQVTGAALTKAWRRHRTELNELRAKRSYAYSLIFAHGSNPIIVHAIQVDGPHKEDVPECSLHFMEARDAEEHRSRLPIPDEYVVVTMEWRTLTTHQQLRVVTPSVE